MHLLCVIPARVGSQRLPDKPLRHIAGTPLICKVARRVAALGLGGRLVVATDDARVVRVVHQAGFDAVLTSSEHRSGTERVAEVVNRPEYAGTDVVLNVQGDEPFVPAAAVRGALERVVLGDQVGTAAAPLSIEWVEDPNRVKVALDPQGRAMGFSRTLLPAGEGVSSAYLQHVGVYAYTPSALRAWVGMTPVPEEHVEKLEQLRPLKHGMRIGVALLDEEAPSGIDTEEDLILAQAGEVNT